MLIDHAIELARRAREQGNVPLAAGICENVIETGQGPLGAFTLLAAIAMDVGQPWRAAELLKAACAAAPQDADLRRLLESALVQPARQPEPHAPRYLLIKPWGCGVCADLDHVLGGLLLAELTARVPIVHWGEGSLFRDSTDDNAWPAFFDPVSAATVDDLLRGRHQFFPDRWNAWNLRGFNRARTPIGPLAYLSREEDVAVSDMHFGVVDLATWVPPQSPFAGMNIHQLYQALFSKYIRLHPEIAAAVDRFAAAHFKGPMISAHIRGSDKVTEDPDLASCIREVQDYAVSLLEEQTDASLFLLTDDAAIRAEMGRRLGDRLITTDCLRSSSAEGIHLQPHASRKQLGVELLTDMYLAARCDLFIGIGSSNVSAMIPHLRPWPKGACRLLGPSLLHKRNLLRYMPGMPYETALDLNAHLHNLEVPAK